jgi:alpha-tubulin suppressor-like RCC1 family protein
VIAIAAGDSHTLYLLADGAVKAAGSNHYGQLGDGSTTDRSTPVAVGGLANVTALAAGQSHSLAPRVDGTIRVWGLNVSGQLGNGTTTDSGSPVPVSGLSGAATVAAHSYGDGNVYFHSLAIR